MTDYGPNRSGSFCLSLRVESSSSSLGELDVHLCNEEYGDKGVTPGVQISNNGPPKRDEEA